jgi:SAM-dependent methyltransferase
MIHKDLISGRYVFREENIPEGMTGLQKHARADFIRNINDKDSYIRLDACPYCGFGDFTIVSEADSRGLPSEVSVCAGCGGCFKSAILDDEANKYYYENLSYILRGKDPSQEAREKLFESRVRSQAYPRYDFIRSLAKIDKGDLVLEIGCNDGANLVPWKEHGFKVIGIEIDPRAAAFSRSKGMEIIHGNFLRHGFEGIRPKLVILSHVFEHVTNAGEALKKIAGILGEGGYLFIEVPGIRGQGIGRPLNYFDAEHNYYFDQRTLRAILEKYGFGTVYCDEYIRSVFSMPAGEAVSGGKAVLPGKATSIRKMVIDMTSVWQMRLEELFGKGEDNSFRIRLLKRMGLPEAYFENLYGSINRGVKNDAR